MRQMLQFVLGQRWGTPHSAANLQRARKHRMPHQNMRLMSSVSSNVSAGISQSVKPFSSIPGPVSLPVFGTLLPYKIGLKKLPTYHQDVCNLYHKYGPIVREDFGSLPVIHLFDPADIRTVYESDGKMPHVPPLQETTQFYRQQKNMSLGLGNLNGEEWYKLRHAVQQMMLRPREVSYYFPLQDSVAKKSVEKLELELDDQGYIPHLRFLIGKWILESAGMCCFEKPLGCLNGGAEEDLAQEMIEANFDIFKLSAELKFSLRLYRYFRTPKYKKLHALEDYFYGVSLKFISDTMNEIKALMAENKLEDGHFNFLTYLMSRKELSEEDVITITLSLFSDGLSTTAPTFLGNLHCLALNPGIQEQLYQEIKTHVDPDAPITVHIINKLHYLKACVKEVFRTLYGNPICTLLEHCDIICTKSTTGNTFTMSEEQNDTLELPKQEAEEFVIRILEESLPETYPPNIEWINCLIQAFQRKQPFQNITLMSQYATRHVPTWEDIYRDILQEGKGGLCLSLNFAFAAVLRSLGVCAYSAAADYVASCGRAVHAVTIIRLCTPHRMCPNCLEYAGTSGRLDCTPECQVRKSRDFPRIKNSYRHFGNREKNISRTPKVCQTSKCRKIWTFDTDMVYLADVGCGFPTLQAINLKDDLKKVYVDCCLEYCIIKKAHRYLRMHRAGDEVPEGEKECVDKDGWRPVFSFTLTPRPLSYFQQTMRSIFVSLEQSPYFTELHLVRYLNFHEMIALKNETCIESLYFHRNKKPDCNFLEGSIINTSRNWKAKKIEMKLCNEFSEKKHRRNKIKLNEKEMLFFIREHFPMIPGYEAEKALHHYFSVQTKSGQ